MDLNFIIDGLSVAAIAGGTFQRHDPVTGADATTWSQPSYPNGAAAEEPSARVTGFLRSGREAGARVVTSGERMGNAGYFVAPTGLTDTRPEMSVVRNEIFGPVVCAMPFGDVALPFGGYKESGRGREMGKEALELYTETKAVAAAL